MVPVQRTAKLSFVVSAERLGTGLAKAQSKSISLSVRVISGWPSRPGWAKYSALRPALMHANASVKMSRDQEKFLGDGQLRQEMEKLSGENPEPDKLLGAFNQRFGGTLTLQDDVVENGFVLGAD